MPEALGSISSIAKKKKAEICNTIIEMKNALVGSLVD
jgi:hypothetical protein